MLQVLCLLAAVEECHHAKRLRERARIERREAKPIHIEDVACGNSECFILFIFVLTGAGASRLLAYITRWCGQKRIYRF
jgi:hypothetical protein